MNAKIIIGALIAAILIGFFWVGNTQPIDCSKIASSKNIEKCVGTEITAVGIMQCQKPGIDRKAGVHYLIFDDKTELRFLAEYKNCDNIDGKKVMVKANLYDCDAGSYIHTSQCAGIGLTNIVSVTLAE